MRSTASTELEREQALELFEANINLAAIAAKRYFFRTPPRVEYDDLHQEALIALWIAALNFDPSHGAGFKTYAYIRMRGAMGDWVRHQSWIPRSEASSERALASDDPNFTSPWNVYSLQDYIERRSDGGDGPFNSFLAPTAVPKSLWHFDEEPAWIEDWWTATEIENFFDWWRNQKRTPFGLSDLREAFIRAWMATGSVSAAIEYLGEPRSTQAMYQITSGALMTARRYGEAMGIRRQGKAKPTGAVPLPLVLELPALESSAG